MNLDCDKICPLHLMKMRWEIIHLSSFGKFFVTKAEITTVLTRSIQRVQTSAKAAYSVFTFNGIALYFAYINFCV